MKPNIINSHLVFPVQIEHSSDKMVSFRNIGEVISEWLPWIEKYLDPQISDTFRFESLVGLRLTDLGD